MNPNSRSRCVFVCAAFIGLFSIFSFRLIYLQAIKHDEYAGLAAEKHVYKQIIYAERGMILDANKEVLAHNIPMETVVADATHLNNSDATVDLLRSELRIPSGQLAEKLNGGRRYIIIKRDVPAHTANALQEKHRAGNLRGIYFEHDATRIYPNGSMLCHVIGFTDFDHHGIQGVEASMDEYLHGQDGYRFIEHNRAGQEIVPYRGQERAPRDGYQIHLTVDLGLQNIVENEIDAAMQQYSPQKATIILMRPQTGEILAMANRPHFDLNLRSEAKPDQMTNRALSVGEQKFYEYIRRFGFGERTGIELPGEINGLIRPPQSWSKISITRIPMGHEIGVTPLQMTVAMATIANGGKLIMPRIVKSITTLEGKTVSSLSPVVLRQVISSETAREIGDALRGVVSDNGTAAAAAVPGFIIAGKTGTAQKVNPRGGYDEGKYVVSFAGYLPADHPEFVGLVMLDDAHTSKPELNYGGLVAGPIFSRVAERAARYLDLEPHEEIRKAIPVARVEKKTPAERVHRTAPAERVVLTNASHH